MTLRTLLLLLIVVSGCFRTPDLEIANTSGVTQQVAVFSGTDIYLVDSVPAGQTKIWTVPDHGRGKRVVLSIAVSRETEAAIGWPTKVWIDSVMLVRSWFVQVHAPKFVEATPAWTERAKRFGTVDRRDTVPPPRDALAEIWDTRPASIRWSTAPHYAPNVSIEGRRASRGGYLWLVGMGVVGMWLSLFFVSRWVLRRSRAPRPTAVILLIAVCVIGALATQSSSERRISYTLGFTVGSVAVLLMPVLLATALELRRRRGVGPNQTA